LILAGIGTAAIVTEAHRLLDDAAVHWRMAQAHKPWGDGLAAARIATVLATADARGLSQ
jgi:UDP-N-acetylglucosamine 2-epimerase (non-hydrolysing)